jgi:hypothetical protein
MKLTGEKKKNLVYVVVSFLEITAQDKILQITMPLFSMDPVLKVGVICLSI